MIGTPWLPTPGTVADEVFLRPGDLHVGRAPTVVRTLLGSCVAVTLWHPGTGVGGMCHFVLPSDPGTVAQPPGGATGWYGDSAIATLVQGLRTRGCAPEGTRVAVVGGAHQFTGPDDPAGVPRRNVAAALQLVAAHGLRVHARHVGGRGPRTVALDLATGEVQVRFGGELAVVMKP